MNADDFGAFFNELWGFEPFPWQSELMKRAAERGWPEMIDLPTSCGKTSIIDIALFHLALEADKAPTDRQAPMRIIFTIDRRLVVDDAYMRACKIRDKLAEASQGILAEVAGRLRKLSGCEEHLKVIELRGGLPHEPIFIQNPLQPTIVLSTVDQVGSRLLFRGYGVSQASRPIYAALVGTDSILILDEAHLSKPFEETLKWVKRYQSSAWAEEIIYRPMMVVRMTATPSKGGQDYDLLKVADWDHPKLGRRLTCSKPAKLVSIKWDKENPSITHKLLLETLSSNAQDLMEKISGAPVIGIVVNRVATARQVFERLNSKGDAVLLIGRTRPLDRDVLIKDYLPRMRAGREAKDNPRPLYVVATQTIEVGADIDFDALVTEAAALDALRQRFGRLNRLGNRDSADAVIIYVDHGRTKDIDPIYGSALAETWKWLKQRASNRIIDFGIRAMKAMLEGKDVTQLLTPSKAVPVLLPSHVDMFIQTMPSPAVEPEIAPYLHGMKTVPEDVQIVWRADLPEESKAEEEAIAMNIAATLSPTQLEVLALPVQAARAFLAGLGRDDIPDVEGGEGEAETVIREAAGRYAVRWRGEDLSVIHSPNEIAPDDTIMVPSSYGGLDAFGWHPLLQQPVKDIGDEAATRQYGIQMLRIHENIIPQWTEEQEIAKEARIFLKNAIMRLDDGDDLKDLCDELIEKLNGLPLKQNIKQKLTDLKSNRTEHPYPGGILLKQKREGKVALQQNAGIPLDKHCADVANLVGSFAEGSGLMKEIVYDEVLAARLHDAGKADPRFQLWLYEANPIAMRKANLLLAKSAGATDWRSIRMYRDQAGYPAGARHECYSVAMVMGNGQLSDQSADRELVAYLIGTHHGRGRPLMPAIADKGASMRYEADGRILDFRGQHHLEQLDSGWPDMFWRLNRRYGYWGLASLEMLLRLADQRQSAMEEMMQDEA